MNVAIYIRMGYKHSFESKELQDRRKLFETYAKENGHKVVRWFEDLGVSGLTEPASRPKWSSLLKSIDQGKADAIIVQNTKTICRDIMIL